jgi:ribulose kinase
VTSKSKTDPIAARCTQIADKVVPEYRGSERGYSCTGSVAKRWQAAWDGACVALGHDPENYRTGPLEVGSQ